MWQAAVLSFFSPCLKADQEETHNSRKDIDHARLKVPRCDAGVALTARGQPFMVREKYGVGAYDEHGHSCVMVQVAQPGWGALLTPSK